MQSYTPINCDHHDYIELACVRGYPLIIILTDGSEVRGRALTTETRADHSEWLVVETAVHQRSIRLDSIAKISTDIEGASFSSINLK
ncbi:transcriptional antiterminator [Shewanella sp. Scap07]|uniref:Rho-binding antiterminator n=1 Tax=Shewanella sp. Scap07 TaxID=2589987 RepID=UPI0015BDAA65|nr:Rho-binding antiterminator [Shewanella sp. Scap07]QLE83977.1 transcriptional antiterminator [Shewanella sp. Scap07]